MIDVSVVFSVTVAILYGAYMGWHANNVWRKRLQKQRLLNSRKYIYLYDEAVDLLCRGQRELGELRLQEYSKKTGIRFFYQRSYIDEPESEAFNPDAL